MSSRSRKEAYFHASTHCLPPPLVRDPRRRLRRVRGRAANGPQHRHAPEVLAGPARGGGTRPVDPDPREGPRLAQGPHRGAPRRRHPRRPRHRPVFVRDRLREWGWDAEIVEYEVLLNYPEPASRRAGDRPPRPSRYCPSARTPSRPTRTRPATTPGPPSTATASRVTSRGRSSMPTTARPRTSRRWSRWAWTSKARSSSPATAACSGA